MRSNKEWFCLFQAPEKKQQLFSLPAAVKTAEFARLCLLGVQISTLVLQKPFGLAEQTGPCVADVASSSACLHYLCVMSWAVPIWCWKAFKTRSQTVCELFARRTFYVKLKMCVAKSPWWSMVF